LFPEIVFVSRMVAPTQAQKAKEKGDADDVLATQKEEAEVRAEEEAEAKKLYVWRVCDET